MDAGKVTSRCCWIRKQDISGHTGTGSLRVIPLQVAYRYPVPVALNPTGTTHSRLERITLTMTLTKNIPKAMKIQQSNEYYETDSSLVFKDRPEEPQVKLGTSQ